MDKDGGVSEYNAVVTVNNVAPTATFNTPASVNEGASFVISLTSPVDVPADLARPAICLRLRRGYSGFGASN